MPPPISSSGADIRQSRFRGFQAALRGPLDVHFQCRHDAPCGESATSLSAADAIDTCPRFAHLIMVSAPGGWCFAAAIELASPSPCTPAEAEQWPRHATVTAAPRSATVTAGLADLKSFIGSGRVPLRIVAPPQVPGIFTTSACRHGETDGPARDAAVIDRSRAAAIDERCTSIICFAASRWKEASPKPRPRMPPEGP